MNFPVLSVITFTPIVAGVLILLLPAQRKNEARAVALAAATFALILSFWTYLNYNHATAGYQFVEKYDWLPALGISLHFGVDGMFAADPLAMAVAIEPGIVIRSERRHVTVELGGRHTRGQTTVDWYSLGGHAPNAELILDVDVARLWDMLKASLG